MHPSSSGMATLCEARSGWCNTGNLQHGVPGMLSKLRNYHIWGGWSQGTDWIFDPIPASQLPLTAAEKSPGDFMTGELVQPEPFIQWCGQVGTRRIGASHFDHWKLLNDGDDVKKAEIYAEIISFPRCEDGQCQYLGFRGLDVMFFCPGTPDQLCSFGAKEMDWIHPPPWARRPGKPLRFSWGLKMTPSSQINNSIHRIDT